MVRVEYRIAIPRPEAHLVDVEMRVRDAPAGPLLLKMPAWTPGSYLVRDHARHVQDLAAGRSNVRRMDKHTWRVDRRTGDLAVRYRVYANDLSVRTSHVDATHAYLDGTSVFLYADGHLDAPATVELGALPRGWRADTPLAPAGPGRWRAGDYHELVDSPFEIGTHRRLDFRVGGKRHRVALWGRGNEDEDALRRDLAAIVREEAATMGGMPYRDYLFVLHLTDQAKGGLEHRSSNTSAVDRWTFEPRKRYEDFLALEAHEFFHLWNVKRARPQAFAPYDYERENYTTLLWAMEGLTSYYDHLVLARAGLITEERYREYVAETMTKLREQPGRLKLSLEESSRLAWVKLYKADENWVNTGISYYLKGELVGLALDLAIHDRTDGKRSLDDVMRAVLREYPAGIPEEPENGWRRALERTTGHRWGPFWDAHVAGTEELDLERYLKVVGWRLVPVPLADETEAAKKGDYTRAGGWLGCAWKEDAGRLKVKHVLAGSPAERAGLAAGDEIVSVDGHRAKSEAFVKDRLRETPAGGRLHIAYFRRDVLTEARITLAEPPVEKWKVEEDTAAGARAKRLRAAWLAPRAGRRSRPVAGGNAKRPQARARMTERGE